MQQKESARKIPILSTEHIAQSVELNESEQKLQQKQRGGSSAIH